MIIYVIVDAAPVVDGQIPDIVFDRSDEGSTTTITITDVKAFFKDPDTTAADLKITVKSSDPRTVATEVRADANSNEVTEANLTLYSEGKLWLGYDNSASH